MKICHECGTRMAGAGRDLCDECFRKDRVGDAKFGPRARRPHQPDLEPPKSRPWLNRRGL